jgi:hypothetical protein
MGAGRREPKRRQERRRNGGNMKLKQIDAVALDIIKNC